GLTMSRLIVAATLNRRNGNVAPRYLYVVLSCLRSLAGLTLLQELPSDPNHSAYKIGADLLARLRDLEAQTTFKAASFIKHFKYHGQAAAAAAAAAAAPARRVQTALELAYARIRAQGSGAAAAASRRG
ncbi:MAG: hypothetical protein P4L81_03615, partial [Candidatus Pacebacteria bacterium]|nr:hypothetical protein [Candidatus Paceibacterota bacterium]